MANRTGAMHCPHCGYAYSKGLGGQSFAQAYRRRRQCLKCEVGFVTYEVLASDWAILMELRRWQASLKDLSAGD